MRHFQTQTEDLPIAARPPSACGFATIALVVAALASPLRADDQEPLYKQTPHDQITLDATNGNVVLDVFLLELPGRVVPENPPKAEELTIRLLDRPEQLFAVQWQHIAKVTLFEQLLLDEAGRRIKEGRFDEAFEYYRFLETTYPKTPGLAEAIVAYLWAHAQSAYADGDDEKALAVVMELYGRDREHAGLADQHAAVVARLAKRYINAENYFSARGLLRGLAEKYPDSEVVAKGHGLLIDKARALQAEAQQDFQAGKLREAQRAAARMLDVWPSLEGATDLALAIHQKYPLVAVAVVSLPRLEQTGLDDWPARRDAPLAGDALVDLVGVGAQGGIYRTALGALESSKDARRLTLRLNTTHASHTGHDIARLLVARTEPRNPAYDPAWAEVLAGIAVTKSDRVELEFRSPQFCAGAWLRGDMGAAAAIDQSLGPYALADYNQREAFFVARLPGGESSRPVEVVERGIAGTSAALAALERGRVSAIDRINPWELARVQAMKDVVVEPYALPTVHVLVPNYRQPLMNRREFRRALVYAIDRASILNRALLNGQSVAGSRVISGPFPRAVSKDDLHGYAYNMQVESRAYDPATAMMLAAEAIQETALSERRRGRQFAVLPPLVIAHPTEATARLACQSIARQLRLLGLQVSLQEVPPGEMPKGEYHLTYLELGMEEPAVDVWRLFGPGGPAGDSSAYIHRALRDLERAPDWKQLCAKLQAIHELVHNEAAVIPLWQIVEHFAYHASLKGVGERPVNLYQNIDRWQVELRIPAE